MKFLSVTHALFQANLWRDYAMSWDGKGRRHSKDWVEHILRISRADCLRRAREALEAAKELNKLPSPLHLHEYKVGSVTFRGR